MINDLKDLGKWKIPFLMTINFLSSKDTNETRAMHSKSNHIEIMISKETDEIIQDFFFFYKKIKMA